MRDVNLLYPSPCTALRTGAARLVWSLRSAVMSRAMRLLVACVVGLLTIGGIASSIQVAPASSKRARLYDPNPNHLWNRIHEEFHIRVARDRSEYGLDTVDPLLWRETQHLLRGPSYASAARVLDEFLTSNGESQIRDRVKRAVFQHDLWAIFDWLALRSESENKAARSALMQRVARVIRRVALSQKNIEALPDTYAAAIASGAFAAASSQQQPYLPRELFSSTGPWVGVGGTEPLVPQHAAELGRSAFIVLWNLPSGSAETREYLQKLWNFPQPFVVDETFQFARDGEVRAKLNPALPRVPDGTQIALVRKMLLIADTGAIVPSNIVESIQVRAFPGRTFSEVRFSRGALFTGKAGGLRTVAADDRDFITFSAKGTDPFEIQSFGGPARLPRVLDSCINCHQMEFEPAIETVRSLRQMLRPGSLVDSRYERWARWFTQPIVAAEAKSRSYEWGLLQGLWQSQPR